MMNRTCSPHNSGISLDVSILDHIVHSLIFSIVEYTTNDDGHGCGHSYNKWGLCLNKHLDKRQRWWDCLFIRISLLNSVIILWYMWFLAIFPEVSLQSKAIQTVQQDCQSYVSNCETITAQPPIFLIWKYLQD